MNETSSATPAGFTDDPAESHISRGERKHESYERLIARAKDIPPISTAVVWPCETHALEGPMDAAKENIIKPLLVGNESRIRTIAEKAGLELNGCEIIEAPTAEEASTAAVSLVREGKAQSLMKGSLHTDVLMHAVVARRTVCAQTGASAMYS